MRIMVPEDIGGELRKLEGVAVATLQSISFGKSKAGHPKATLKYILTEEMDGIPEGEASTVGETVLETFSLQPQSMWKLNDLYKSVMGERIPQGDYGQEEFEQMLNEALVGHHFNLVLELQIPSDGSSTDPRTTVTSRTFID